MNVPDIIKVPRLNTNSNQDERPLKGYELDIMYIFKKGHAISGYALAFMRIEALLKINLSNPSLKEAIASLVEYGYVTKENRNDGENLVLTKTGYEIIMKL